MSLNCDFKKKVHKQRQSEAKYNAKVRKEKREMEKSNVDS